MPDSSREYRPEISAALDNLTRSVADRVTMGELVDRLGGRAFGLLILVLAIPNAVGLGTLPGLSTVFGVPQLLIALQRTAGRDHPWLPRRLRARSVARADLERVIGKTRKYLHKIERVLRPRWPAFTSPIATRLVAAVVALLAALISLPLPFANQPPAIAITVLAVGMIAGDGLVVALGLFVSLVAVALAAGIVVGGAGGLIALAHQFFS
jgi:hypothetical protein